MKSAVNLDSHTVTDIEFQAASLDIWDAKYRLIAKDGAKIDELAKYQPVFRAIRQLETTR